MDNEDLAPWYKQFWPWFIMALPASAVVAGLYTVYLAHQTTDSLVVTSGGDSQTEAAEREFAEDSAKSLDLGFRVDIDLQSGVILMTQVHGDSDASPATLNLDLRHTTMSSRDVDVVLQRSLPDESGNRTWTGHFVTIPEGRFNVALYSGRDWRISSAWAGEPVLNLGSAAADGHR